jgi:hypothetical protein
MDRTRIFTNNPSVRDAYPDATLFVEGGVCGVFTAVRDAVHKGARLISHPLSGGVKPWQSPYKSVAALVPEVLTGPALDYASLRMVEDAVALCRGDCNADESLLADYRMIDLDLINNALEEDACPKYTTY